MRIPPPSYFAWLAPRARPTLEPLPFAARPKPGDVILRGLTGGRFELVEAITETHIAGPMQRSRAVQLAKAFGHVGIWHQVSDDRGRWLAPPARLRLN